MKTDFYELLENETKVHLIFAHIHRRKNELEFALRKLNCEIDIKKATDEEFLDLVTIDKFFHVLGNLSNGELNKMEMDLFYEERRRNTKGPCTLAGNLGVILSYRVVGLYDENCGFEYNQIVNPSEEKLRYLRKTEVKAAKEAEAARLAAEDEKLKSDLLAMLAA